MTCVSIAGFNIGLDVLCPSLNSFFSGFCSREKDPVSDFNIACSVEEIVREKEMLDQESSVGNAESNVIFKKMEEEMGERKAFVINGSFINIKRSAYAIFSNNPEDRRNFMKRMISQLHCEAKVLSEEKGILRFRKNTLFVYSTPFDPCDCSNGNFPYRLKCCFVLGSDNGPSVQNISSAEFVRSIIGDFYIPKTRKGLESAFSMGGSLYNHTKALKVSSAIADDKLAKMFNTIGIKSRADITKEFIY